VNLSKKKWSMPSHLLPSIREAGYSEDTFDFYQLDHGIYQRYYSEFSDHLEHNRIDRSAISWYANTVGKQFPMSFILDQKSTFTVLPPVNHRWLIYIHMPDAMHMYLVCYIVISMGRI
jgi:hypothetical protein